MKRITEVFAWLLIIFFICLIIWKIEDYREEQRELYRQEAMCNLSDARLVSSGMIDCEGVREWKN